MANAYGLEGILQQKLWLDQPVRSSQASLSSKLVVIAAVLPSMMLAEQYFSWLMAMARSTAAGGTPLPDTLKCMWMAVNTLGSVSARCAVSLHEQLCTAWRPRLRISTTS